MSRLHSEIESQFNYMDDDESTARIRQAFGENFSRLQKLKDRYDPHNIFRRNQNIPPSV